MSNRYGMGFEEEKYCPRCARYVRFLMSVRHSYCVHCDARVRILSDRDLAAFLAPEPRQPRPANVSTSWGTKDARTLRPLPASP